MRSILVPALLALLVLPLPSALAVDKVDSVQSHLCLIGTPVQRSPVQTAMWWVGAAACSAREVTRNELTFLADGLCVPPDCPWGMSVGEPELANEVVAPQAPAFRGLRIVRLDQMLP